MRVVDTGIWIEIFSGSELGRSQLPLLAAPEAIVVPTIVQYEIFKWLSRERTGEEAMLAITFTGECHVQELTTEIAILAAEIAAIHKLQTTDTIIFATAQSHEACAGHMRCPFQGFAGRGVFLEVVWN